MKHYRIVVLALTVLFSITSAFAAFPEGKIVLAKPIVEARTITVPVHISSSKPLLAFSFKIHYEPSLLNAEFAENSGLITEDFEFFSARPEQKEGWIRVGGLTSFGLKKTIPPGEYHVANVVFELRHEKLDENVRFELEEAELVDVDMSEFEIERVNTMAVPALEIPERDFVLYQNDPNPFETETHISYSIPIATEVKLGVYNVAGQLVRQLVDQEQKPGRHTVLWNGRTNQNKRVANGMYFYRLETPDFQATKKMIITK